MNFLAEICKQPLSMEAKEKPKKELVTSRLVGGRFSKKENLQMRLVLGGTRQVHLQTFPPEFLKFIPAHFILLGFTLLHFTDCVCVCVCVCACVCVCVYKLKVCGNPVSSQSMCAMFPTSFAHSCLCITVWLFLRNQ